MKRACSSTDWQIKFRVWATWCLCTILHCVKAMCVEWMMVIALWCFRCISRQHFIIYEGPSILDAWWCSTSLLRGNKYSRVPVSIPRATEWVVHFWFECYQAHPNLVKYCFCWTVSSREEKSQFSNWSHLEAPALYFQFEPAVIRNHGAASGSLPLCCHVLDDVLGYFAGSRWGRVTGRCILVRTGVTHTYFHI